MIADKIMINVHYEADSLGDIANHLEERRQQKLVIARSTMNATIRKALESEAIGYLECINILRSTTLTNFDEPRGSMFERSMAEEVMSLVGTYGKFGPKSRLYPTHALYADAPYSPDMPKDSVGRSIHPNYNR